MIEIFTIETVDRSRVMAELVSDLNQVLARTLTARHSELLAAGLCQVVLEMRREVECVLLDFHDDILDNTAG